MPDGSGENPQHTPRRVDRIKNAFKQRFTKQKTFIPHIVHEPHREEPEVGVSGRELLESLGRHLTSDHVKTVDMKKDKEERVMTTHWLTGKPIETRKRSYHETDDNYYLQRFVIIDGKDGTKISIQLTISPTDPRLSATWVDSNHVNSVQFHLARDEVAVGQVSGTMEEYAKLMKVPDMKPPITRFLANPVSHNGYQVLSKVNAIIPSQYELLLSELRDGEANIAQMQQEVEIFEREKGFKRINETSEQTDHFSQAMNSLFKLSNPIWLRQ